MPTDMSGLQTLAIGGAIVGFNAMVSAVAVSFANWWTQRAIKKLDREKAATASTNRCACVNCQLFDKCLGKGPH